MAQVEGRLWSLQSALAPGQGIVQITPFVSNFSTLADFIVLNPLIIFFLLKAHQNRRKIYAEAGEQIPPYHKFGLAIVAFAFGVTAMRLYVGGFNQFF